MAEVNPSLWAPWRAEYIQSLHKDSGVACFLCDYIADPSADDSNHVIVRSDHIIMALNRFPYTNGHLLIAPLQHVGGFDGLDDAELLAIARAMRDGTTMLRTAVRAEGVNVGMNFGRCAGAGLPGHLHAHIVPRWSGDTNFMTTVAEARVIPEDLREVHDRLRAAARSLGI